MKNIIDYVLGKTFYAKQLSKMELSLTFYAFFNSDSQADRENKVRNKLKISFKINYRYPYHQSFGG